MCAVHRSGLISQGAIGRVLASSHIPLHGPIAVPLANTSELYSQQRKAVGVRDTFETLTSGEEGRACPLCSPPPPLNPDCVSPCLCKSVHCRLGPFTVLYGGGGCS